MNQSLQTSLLGFAISLLLWGSAGNAAPPTPETSDVEYHRYHDPGDPEGEKYHRFLPDPAPEGVFYDTRWKASANIDDTPEKETIVSILVDRKYDAFAGNWAHAFLLIAEAETQTDALPEKKVFFRLYASDIHELTVPGEVSIKLQSPPFTFRDRSNEAAWKPHGVSFELVDLTGDGILDVWVEFGYAVAVISFQKGEFQEVFSSYSVGRYEPEYVDPDKDGTYEIKMPNSIFINGLPRALYPQWMSLYEWDSTTYVLNNERFYAENDAFLIDLLEDYNRVLFHYGRYEEYSFYIGLVYSYRGDTSMAREYLQWVVEHGKKQDYRTAAEAIFKKLPHQ